MKKKETIEQSQKTITKKNFHVIKGSNHMQLNDVHHYVDEAASVVAPCFKSNP